MADTTIKVGTEVRDRLAVLAAERGTTIRDLVDQLAQATATQAELRQRQDAAISYVRANLWADFGTEDLAAGHQIWNDLPPVRSAPGLERGKGKGGSGGQAA